MLDPVSLHQVLEIVAEFDGSGGASLGLVAWELCVDEELVAPAWQQAASRGLMSPAGRDWHEQLWRLSAAGRAATRSEHQSSRAARVHEQEAVSSELHPSSEE